MRAIEGFLIALVAAAAAEAMTARRVHPEQWLSTGWRFHEALCEVGTEAERRGWQVWAYPDEMRILRLRPAAAPPWLTVISEGA